MEDRATNGQRDVVFDVDQADFETAVVMRSHEVPVVVDFWAAWCGPCRTLSPILEEAVESREGDVLLAKVDVDRNQELAARFGVRGIPAVAGFRDGAVVSQFVGAQPKRRVEAFLDELAPSEADRTVSHGRAATSPDEAETLFRRALELEPDHRQASLLLAGLLVDRDPKAALELITPHRPAPEAETIAARAVVVLGAGDVGELRERVNADPDDPGSRLELAGALAAAGEHDEAIDELLTLIEAGGETREGAREQLLSLLTVLGDDPRVPEARRRLAAALY
ncbi:MAG: thioredoxin [Nitriliruptorales bacterium]